MGRVVMGIGVGIFVTIGDDGKIWVCERLQ